MAYELLLKRDFTPQKAEAVAALMRRKMPLSSAAFDLLTREQRAQAFRIAGINKALLVRRAHKIIDDGLRDGAGLIDIRRQLLAVFEEEGVQAPGLNHLRTLMRQNMLHVQSVARSRTLLHPAVKRAYPYWQYVTVRDSAVRDTHRRLDGLIFRADDPFWDKYQPPWEFGCRCSFLPVSAARLRQLGIVPDEVETLDSVEKMGIEANPDFAFPRDQFAPIDRIVTSMFAGELKKYLKRRFKEAELLELGAGPAR